MRHHRVLRVVSKLLIPFIILFGFYVQFHGDFGPGGGFQAGVIVAAGVILFAMVFGLQRAREVAPPKVMSRLVALGLMLYAGTGFASILMGGEYLNYSVFGATQQSGQHIGILVVELGVGITVAATMVVIFFHFAGYREDPLEEADPEAGPEVAPEARTETPDVNTPEAGA